MKKILAILLCSVTLAALCVFVGSAGAVSDDPADSYVVQTAEYEDRDISLWFDHSFRKNFTSDKTPTGMDTYTVYMAKNEIESAQFLLYSNTDKLKMTADITEFTDANGNTVPAEIYYEMYVTTSNVNRGNIIGGASANPIIRNGETPDPIAPLDNVKTFKLNGGKSQAFLIRLKSAEDTVSGWYSAQLNIRDSEGRQVKTATVYAYVWDFALPEETTFQSSFFLTNDVSYGGTYADFYDYFLENRLNPMDIPGELTPDNPYLLNPRVNSVRVTSHGGGYGGYYADTEYDCQYYGAIYHEMENSDIWDQVKDKFYFYSADEPVCGLTWMPWTGWDIDRTKTMSYMINNVWPDARYVVPHHENTPYPDAYYTRPLSSYEDWQKRDANQELINTGCSSVWCPMTYAFVPNTMINLYGGNIRNMNGFISGVYYPGGANNAFTSAAYNWDTIYGDFYDRVMSDIILKNEAGHDNFQLWEYGCGDNTGYTYCNHLIENTGLQTKLLFWQAFQNDVTGYLYYGTNNWHEYHADPDRTVTGAKTTCTWYNNSNGSVYGNGHLFYGPIMGRIAGVKVIGTVRVEYLRDSVEEYEMLTMLSEYKNRDRAKEIVSQVTKNNVKYLSLNNFSTAGWASDMDAYDIMAAVRKGLGDELEAAAAAGKCDHVWGNGTVTAAATCLKMGTEKFTCTLCGETKTEKTPTLHSIGDCFVKTGGSAATCTAEGNEKFTCTICGYSKGVNTLPHHSDMDCFVYVEKNETGHSVICGVCGEVLDTESHTVYPVRTRPTCTEPGITEEKCIRCGMVLESYDPEEALGHNFENGACTLCGEADPSVITVIPGDVDGDGKITAKDVNVMKKIITGAHEYSDAADLNFDGKVTVSDINALKKIIVGA